LLYLDKVCFIKLNILIFEIYGQIGSANNQAITIIYNQHRKYNTINYSVIISARVWFIELLYVLLFIINY
jgi:hypothetical protein